MKDTIQNYNFNRGITGILKNMGATWKYGGTGWKYEVQGRKSPFWHCYKKVWKNGNATTIYTIFLLSHSPSCFFPFKYTFILIFPSFWKHSFSFSFFLSFFKYNHIALQFFRTLLLTRKKKYSESNFSSIEMLFFLPFEK